MQPLVDMVVMWLHGTTACEISLPTSVVGPTFLCGYGLDMTVTSKTAGFPCPIPEPGYLQDGTPVSLNNASASVGAAAYAAECRTHAANDTRCQGWDGYVSP